MQPTATVTVPPRRSNLVSVLLSAMQFAERQRIKLGVDGYGVTAISTRVSPIWERDTRAESMSPIGAAILQHQPRTADPTAAAAIALDANPAILTGIECGLRREAPPFGMLTAPNNRLFRYGMEVGATLRRMIVAHECIAHGAFRGEQSLCPKCAELLSLDAEARAV